MAKALSKFSTSYRIHLQFGTNLIQRCRKCRAKMGQNTAPLRGHSFRLSFRLRGVHKRRPQKCLSSLSPPVHKFTRTPLSSSSPISPMSAFRQIPPLSIDVLYEWLHRRSSLGSFCLIILMKTNPILPIERALRERRDRE